MKRLIILLLVLVSSSLFSQTSLIKGSVVDEKEGSIPYARIEIGTSQVTSESSGAFILQVPYGNWTYSISAEGFEDYVGTIEVEQDVIDMGFIILKSTADISTMTDISNDIRDNLIDLDDEGIKSQNISSILTSSKDVFVNTASFNFSAARFRIRGYDNEFSRVLFNGLIMENGETNRAPFSLWTGLNDATRFREEANALNPASYSLGMLGGSVNFDVRPSNQRQQTKISYSVANRSYVHRIMATTSTGLMDNGWAFVFSGSKRIGNEAYVEGVFYDGWSYYGAAEKKINNSHSISINVFAAPVTRSMQAPAVQEVYDLMDNNYYNPNWGYQDGKVRNAKVRKNHEPVVLLSHFWDINPNTSLVTMAGFMTGRNGTTSLNWYNAADPRPDYYRYLPSYQQDDAVTQLYIDAWQNDASHNQIDWDKLYQINYLSAMAGGQSRYILEERRMDQTQYSFASNFNHQLNNNIHISAGLDARRTFGDNYKTVHDLMGGEFWVDVDQFAERDFSGDSIMLQNDLNNPNRVVREGDIFGYHYKSNISKVKLWGLSEFAYSKMDFYVGAEVTNVQYWREGMMRNGRYPESSFGKSEVLSNFDYIFKGGATYKITGRHYLSANTAFMSLLPSFYNAFVSLRTRNEIIPDLEARSIYSGDLNYDIRYPRLKGRFSLYHTRVWNDSDVKSFYHDELRTFVNQVLTNIEKVHQGMEMGLEVQTTQSLWVQAAAAIGNYRYVSRPDAIITADNGSIPTENSIIYMNNFYVAGTPQKAYSLGLRYQGKKFWFANLSANYFDDVWIDFNPERRTERAVANISPDDPLIAEITHQLKAKPGFTLDASLGKSWKIKDYYINLNINVNNVLDNKNLVTGGFEQLRFDFANKDVGKFPPKYFYSYGRTYFLMLALRF